MQNKNDEALLMTIKTHLFSAVIGDVLDQMGQYHQFLPPYIRPLQEDMILCGRAMPVVECDKDISLNTVGFGRMFEALDDLKPNEVYICSGASMNYALWGELMSTRAQLLGAAGVVLNGYTRDTKGILSLGFPCFSAGCYAQDQQPRGYVQAFRVPIQFGDVTVNPGDIVFGDRDGVVIIPQEIEQDVIRLAMEKVRGENLVAQALKNGMPAAKAFELYGIM